MSGHPSQARTTAGVPALFALKFDLAKPHYYEYTYQSAGAQEFLGQAKANLDGDGTTTADSTYSLKGCAGPALKAIVEATSGPAC